MKQILLALLCLGFSNTVPAISSHWHDSDFIVQSFSTIALSGPASKKVQRIKKWEKEINFHFVHKIADQQLHEQLTRLHLQHLASITGLDIKQTNNRNKANLVILFSQEENLLRDFMSEIGAKPTRKIKKLTSESVCLSQIKFNSAGKINHATVIIPVDRARERAKLLTCIVEELSQVLGLPNDSEKVYPSIFNDKSFNELLTGLDYLMLKMLYDRRVKAGMDRRQVMPVLRKIVKEYQQKNIVQAAELKVMEGGLYPLLY